MSIVVKPHARTGDKLADVEELARMLAVLNVNNDAEPDNECVNTARSIGAELLRILTGKPRTEIIVHPGLPLND